MGLELCKPCDSCAAALWRSRSWACTNPYETWENLFEIMIGPHVVAVFAVRVQVDTALSTYAVKTVLQVGAEAAKKCRFLYTGLSPSISWYSVTSFKIH